MCMVKMNLRSCWRVVFSQESWSRAVVLETEGDFSKLLKYNVFRQIIVKVESMS